MSKKLTIGFSPCPNDTFIFDAMIHHKIDTEELEFDVFMGDVEELNKKAFNQELDITKLSYHAFVYLIKDYILLNSGSALGENCGPLLITKNEGLIQFLNTNPTHQELQQKLHNATIAIPGKYTTANFLLSLAFPDSTNKEAVIFSAIEAMVNESQVDAGLIIHENRFTYQDKGLIKIIDLGAFWEATTKLPIPLGGIVINRTLDDKLQQKVDRVLKRSVQYAFDNPTKSLTFIAENAQEMDAEITKAHISLYVNDYSLNLGKKGRTAVEYLVNKSIELELISSNNLPIFVTK